MSFFVEENSVGTQLCPLEIHKCVSKRIHFNAKGVLLLQGGGGGRGEKGGEKDDDDRKRAFQKTTLRDEEESGFGGFGGENKRLLLGLRFFLFPFRS